MERVVTEIKSVDDLITISEEEYQQIDVMVANSHGVNLSTLCCRNPLLLSDFRANMSQSEGKGDDMNASDN